MLFYVSLSQFSPPGNFVYASVTLSLHPTYTPIFYFHQGQPRESEIKKTANNSENNSSGNSCRDHRLNFGIRAMGDSNRRWSISSFQPDTPRTVDGQLDSSPIRDANESDAGANERPGLRPAGRKTDWPTQMHTVIINLLEILRNRTDIHCAASSPEPAFPHTPSGVCAFFVPYFRVKEKSRDKLIAVTFISSRWLRSQQRKELCNCCGIL